MEADRLQFRIPGVVVTATDTEVGKTTIACALAWQLRRAGLRVGVCKPVATGCRRDREGLVSEDAEALAHFADCPLPLDVINPIRFRPPLAPAMAMEATGQPVEWSAVVESLHRLEAQSDMLVIEGVGGILVPMNAADPRATFLDWMQRLPFPAVVVTRAGLGTLNHTAMTVRLLRAAGIRVLGLVINRYQPDSPDASMAGNARWLQQMNGVPVLATVPQTPADQCQPQRGIIAPAILEALGTTYWAELLESGAGGRRGSGDLGGPTNRS